MTLFAGGAVFVFARGLVPGLGKMLVTAATTAAVRQEHALAGGGEVGQRFAGIVVVDHGADRDLENEFRGGMAGAIGTFAVAAAIGLEFAVEAVAQQSVVVGIGFGVDAAAAARSEEHTSELQSHVNLVCRLL